METLFKNKFLHEQNADVQIILANHSWANRYEKIKIGYTLYDLSRCLNPELQSAIDKFEDENDLSPLKFTSESLARYLQSIGLTLE